MLQLEILFRSFRSCRKTDCSLQSQKSPEPQRSQSPSRESSWNSQSTPSRSRSNSPHEDRLKQQQRIQAARAAKPRGESPQSSYYNSNKGRSGGGRPSDNGAQKDFGERADQAVNQLGDGIRGGSGVSPFQLFPILSYLAMVRNVNTMHTHCIHLPHPIKTLLLTWPPQSMDHSPVPPSVFFPL